MSSFKLTSEQEHNIALILNKEDKIVVINANSGSSKAQPYSEPILTPNGWTTMGELNIEDEVVGSDGKATKILNIYEHGIRPVYEITFIDGVKVRCDLDHLWSVYNGNSKKAKLQTLSLREIINYSPKFHGGRKTKYKRKRFDKRYGTHSNYYFWSVPNPKPIKFNDEDNYIIPPFTLGVLISEGSLTATDTTVYFTSSSEKVIKRVKSELPNDFILSKKKYGNNKAYTCKIIHKNNVNGINYYQNGNPYAQELNKLGLRGKKSHERFIPKKYKFMSVKNAKALYDGLTWTDGNYPSKNNNKLKSYSTTSKQLMLDFVELSRQLGLVCKEPKPIKAGYKKDGEYIKCNDCYEVQVKSIRQHNDKSIIDIKFHSKEKVRCIEVDAKDNLYVTTGYTLTHNTTTMLMALKDSRCWFKNGLFLSFNKKIATENAQKVPSFIETKTLHSLAYQYIVKPLKLKVIGSISANDIHHSNYKIRNRAKWLLNKFCTSRFVKIRDFLKDEDEQNINLYEKLLKKTIVNMENGKQPIPHAVYMKLFHIHLFAGSVKMQEYDLLFLDEAGDINGVYLEVFLNIKAKKKVAVGDISQNIYGFNNTMNGIEILIDEYNAISGSLTKTFRCSNQIAGAVNQFMLNNDLNINLVGVNRDNLEPETSLFVTRGNRELLSMIKLCMDKEIKFSLARDVNNLFDDYIYVKVGIYKEWDKYQETNIEPKLDGIKKELWHFFKEWKENEYGTFKSYIEARAENDMYFPENIIRLFKTINGFKGSELIDMKKYAKENKDKRFLIGTVFSTKGLEADIVYIANDLNNTTFEAMEKRVDEKDEIYMYYTACTRAKKVLINAELLEKRLYEEVEGFNWDLPDFIDNVIKIQGKENEQNGFDTIIGRL